MAKVETRFAPLLSATLTDAFPPHFPVLASPKLDGIRVICVDGVPMTRSLKHPVNNRAVCEALQGLPWLDGEIVSGRPTSDAVCAATQSCVMSEEGGGDWCYYVFDLADPAQAHLPFETRHAGLYKIVGAIIAKRPELAGKLRVLKHRRLASWEELVDYEEECVADGYEGIMLRSLDGRYKFGRATAKERILTKVKRWDDAEGIILEVHEEQHNMNAAKKNKLGKTERSSHKAGKVGKNTLGGYTVHTFANPDGTFGLYPDTLGYRGVKFYLGAAANMTAEERKVLWDKHTAAAGASSDNLIGKTVTFKYQKTLGAKAPRFPVFKVFRGDE